MAPLESAAIVPVADLAYPDDVGRKVRVAGFCSSYDTDTGELWLEHERVRIAVDLSLVLEAGTRLELHPKSKWMCIGTLERHRGSPIGVTSGTMDPATSTSRDRVRDGPMTYNETVLFVRDLLECAIHTILAVRQVYPAEVFVRRKRYETPVFQSRHPGLNEYIGTTCNAIMHELQHASLRQVVIALVDEDAPNADVLERYVFALDFLLPDTDVRNRDLVIKGNLSQAAAELVARQFLLQLLTLEARLPPAGERPCTFRVLIEMDADQTPTANSDQEPSTGPWAPADGVPFRANAVDNAQATLSLHVEAYAEDEADASQATTYDVHDAALSQRDLDDPDIEQGASTSAIPLRKRKLFAQPVTTGGPTSDASSAESDESDGSDESLSAPP
ncbi:hypothetical protein MBRA1_002451 [Malassezia brasiliensis]|uniref:HORMA domain-containing protein n=1 Tax=Malassezia brasiliensis TaxID=1821822 RepID=A0AAF0DUW9_9BASI|nr:hypothetical protein MBRA1_002451 [Malassezia brasiliensis]